MSGSKRSCKDCPEGLNRPAPYPGPRCSTHNRAFQKASKLASHGKMVEKVYGISGEEYWRLYEEQGGVCYICRRAKGTSKRLAVDHDHRTGLVRGLLCSICNSHLAHIRSDVETSKRIVEYLERANDNNRRLLAGDAAPMADLEPDVPVDTGAHARRPG